MTDIIRQCQWTLPGTTRALPVGSPLHIPCIHCTEVTTTEWYKTLVFWEEEAPLNTCVPHEHDISAGSSSSYIYQRSLWTKPGRISIKIITISGGRLRTLPGCLSEECVQIGLPAYPLLFSCLAPSHILEKNARPRPVIMSLATYYSR